MKAPFRFRKVIFLVEATGRRAANLDELLRGVTLVDTRCIGFHMHRGFLSHRFVHAEFPNDFADWVARVIGDEMLAERLANLNVFRYRTFAELRGELARLVADHLSTIPSAAAERAPAGREFYFQTARSIVLDCPQSAADLPSFAAALAAVPASSIFFHLFETRFNNAELHNDFARWIRDSLGLDDLAAHVARLDPYMLSVEEARRKLVQLVSAHPHPHAPPPGAAVLHETRRG